MTESVELVGLEDLRHRHLGIDPVAKRLYALVFDARTTYHEAAALLDQYLRDQDGARQQ